MSLLNADAEQSQDEIGEDTLDLFLLIQDSFGIEFDEADDIVGKSVAEIARCIQGKSDSCNQGCLSAATFYLLRHELCSLAALPRHSPRPSAMLSNLLPWSARKKLWNKLEERTSLCLPPLVFAGWLLLGSFITTLAGVYALSAVVNSYTGWHTNWLMIAGWSLGIWVVILFYLQPLARSFPNGCHTFADLVRLTAAHNYSTLSRRFCGSTEREMMVLLTQLIAFQVGIPQENITAQTRVPQDLSIY